MTTTTSERLLRVAYFSLNAIKLPRDQAYREVDLILETSQTNNARCGVTGALLFNNGAFAQILEGPGDAVEETFDRVQIDDRHHDVTVLQTDWVEGRMFPNWTMGFAGNDEAAAIHYAGIADRSSFDIESLSASDLATLLGEIAKRNEMKARAA
ncbi:MAG: BLUF domain-containing protein [Pseudomonadota bacterium]